ncbi:hypothetical protein RCL1_005716 [Eukaryota sp. TZLM3-RCL]
MIVPLLLVCTLVFANNVVTSRPFDTYPQVLKSVDNFYYLVSLSESSVIVFTGSSSPFGISFDSFSILEHVSFSSISPSMLLHSSICVSQDVPFQFHTLFSSTNTHLTHLHTFLTSDIPSDVILIAFEFSSSNSNNQFDQLSLKVFSLLNLQESNNFEFIVENDLVTLSYNEFSLEQDQSIIANITITHNSNQCTTEFPYEVQFNSIVSCSFCISSTGYTNTSSFQIIDKSIELQTNITSYCPFLKESVPLFLLVSDHKLVIRDVIQRRSLEIATPLSGVRSVDFISTTDSKSLFMILICNENNCDLRVVALDFVINDLIPDLSVIVLAVGTAHSAAVFDDGTIKMWGWGANGRLGLGHEETQLFPTSIDDISDAVSVSCGFSHTLVLQNNGLVLAFGSNLNGQLGDSTTTQRLSAITVSNLANVIAISAGHSHSLALRRDGTVYSWGFNGNGVLGRTVSNHNDRVPRQVEGLSNVVTISTRSVHNLAVLTNGKVVGWGSGASGRLGNENESESQNSVQNVGSFSSAVNVSAGGAFSLILLEGGDLWVTGGNWDGQLGLGHTDNQLVPAHLSGYKFAVVAAGALSSVGVLTNGSVVVWGSNGSSQLGDGTTDTRISPFLLSQLPWVNAVSVSSHVLVATKNGSVFGWGNNNSGQIGDGTTETHSTAVQINVYD